MSAFHKIYLQVKANAKENRVEKIDSTHFKVLVKAPPKEGKANEAVFGALSDFFHLPKSRFSLVTGKNSKTKVITF